jgi:hypothetical protein
MKGDLLTDQDYGSDKETDRGDETETNRELPARSVFDPHENIDRILGRGHSPLPLAPEERHVLRALRSLVALGDAYGPPQVFRDQALSVRQVTPTTMTITTVALVANAAPVQVAFENPARIRLLLAWNTAGSSCFFAPTAPQCAGGANGGGMLIQAQSTLDIPWQGQLYAMAGVAATLRIMELIRDDGYGADTP